MKFKVKDAEHGAFIVTVLLFLPLIFVLGALLSLWAAWWIQDIWAQHLVSMLGAPPSVLAFAIFVIALRAVIPTSTNDGEDGKFGLVSLALGPPFAWTFANLVWWIG